MLQQTDPLVEWQFVEVSAPPESRWRWKKIVGPDALETVSRDFEDYGLAVCDALRHGFKPKRQRWSTVTRHGTTRYEAGGETAAVPNAAAPGSFLPPPAPAPSA